jgi:hypothetical protein
LLEEVLREFRQKWSMAQRRHEEQLMESLRMRKGSFVIEDQFGPYPGYTTGERWNGWATPCFEYEVALRMVEDWNASEWAGGDAYYDASNDQFCFRSGPKEDWDCFPPITCEVEGQERKLYSIGAFCWIWSDETEE